MMTWLVGRESDSIPIPIPPRFLLTARTKTALEKTKPEQHSKGFLLLSQSNKGDEEAISHSEMEEQERGRYRKVATSLPILSRGREEGAACAGGKVFEGLLRIKGSLGKVEEDEGKGDGGKRADFISQPRQKLHSQELLLCALSCADSCRNPLRQLVCSVCG